MEEQIQLKMIQLSQVETQIVRWLWYPFIPYGKLTIIQGDPGDGKSTFILNIAAMLSKGQGFDTDMEQVSMPFLFCMFSPFKKCSFLVKKILLIKQCIDSFLFFFHEFFPFF